MKKAIYIVLVVVAFLSTKTSLAQEVASRVVEDGGTGKFSAVMTTQSSLPTHTVFRPKDISGFGGTEKLPVIAWGNGACFNSPWEHVNFLSEIASHGFLVIAVGVIPKESGEQVKDRSQSKQLLDAIDWAVAQHHDSKSPFYQKIDVNAIAVSGMSCGGLQTLEVASDPRLRTILVCNSGIFSTPGNGRSSMPNLTKESLKLIHTPTLYLLGGERDIAYANGMDDYRQINHVPVFVANMDVGHGGTYSQVHGGEFASVATAWFKWQLKGQSEAGKMFTGDPAGMAENKNWRYEKKNMP
jgi:hypothetical protein